MIQTLSDALAERGYDTLTPVQEAVTNPDLQEADLLVSAQTGSGKTVGFGLAIAPTILDESGHFGPAAAPLALIIAPTRELAFQVKRELEWLYAKAGARVASCVGGMDMRDERRALERGAHIVVGTPGRLVDHIQRESLDMGSLRAIVLDEADEMLDLGFREDLEFMLGEAPEERRTLLFSATVPPAIAKLAEQFQRNAERVTTISDRSQHADITYQVLQVAQQDAENAIINVLRYHDAQNAIVFANTRAAVNRLTARFSNRGFAVVCLSGELSQQERSHALQAMRDGRARVCVATDVAARGIDLPNLELVIHAELPSNTEGLLHRSGRTGRAGRKGISALVVPPKQVKRAQRLLGWAKISADWITAPGADEILRMDEERLLTNPVWQEEITEDEAAFAARLLEQQSPETVAAAYLRLYRTQHSAPEELSDPNARPEPKERKEFGPSRWFSLSVGRDDNAEARWLLPLICRAGGLDKEAIGAIRVRQSETFVEIAEAQVQGFLDTLGPDAVLEDGVSVAPQDGPPASEPRREGGRDGGRGRPSGPRVPAGPRPGKSRWSSDKKSPPQSHKSEDRSDAPGEATEEAPRRYGKAEVTPKAPRRDKPFSKGPAKSTGNKPSKAPAKGPVKGAGKPYSKGKPGGFDRSGPSDKPKGTGKPYKAKPGGAKPTGGKPTGGKPTGPKPTGAKPTGGKPYGDSKPKANASDTSKRFTPPGGKPRSSVRVGRGANQVPKRPKR
ncbi:DEAD/DEAH box helicase [Marinibacterium sp. SX1]|uniref:DEAD/DEAH box helicase n=1 Tax=Marinibacterium sp. SX1 TaxID=3388424 RepID=UPI003D182E9F